MTFLKLLLLWITVSCAHSNPSRAGSLINTLGSRNQNQNKRPNKKTLMQTDISRTEFTHSVN